MKKFIEMFDIRGNLIRLPIPPHLSSIDLGVSVTFDEDGIVKVADPAIDCCVGVVRYA